MHNQRIWLIPLLILMGCAKQASVVSVTETQPAEPFVVCPKFYTSSDDTDTYRRWDDDILDGVRCSDGRIYCFGDNQKPELIPKVSEGYECKPIGGYGDENRFKYEPDVIGQKFMSEEADSVEQYPFCDNGITYREAVKLSFGRIDSQYAWECRDKECICGGKPCRFGSQCYREQCIHSHYKWIFDGNENTYQYEIDENDSSDACLQADDDWDVDYIYYRSDLTDVDKTDERSEFMYKCGDRWFERNSNMTCIPHPKGDIVKFDFCPEMTEEEWEQYRLEKARFDAEHSKEKETMELLRMKGSVSTENGLGNKTVPWNISLNPCLCGDEVCAEDTGCYQDQCVDLANLKPLPEGFVWKQGRPYCDKENCQCDKAICRHGDWCVEGKCFHTRNVMKVDDKYIQYGLYEYSVPRNINHYFDEDAEQALPRDHYADIDNLSWLDIITHRSSALCDDPNLPENTEDYSCIVAHTDNGCNEGFVDSYSFYGFHCMKEEGCDCGVNHCAKNARCYRGHCIYDGIYLAMACGQDLTRWGSDIQADENGWCDCGVSHIQPNQNGYICDTSEPNGMQCWMKDGCTCGDVFCQYKDYCVLPGKCMNANEVDELIGKLDETRCGYDGKGCACGEEQCGYFQYCISPGKCADRTEGLKLLRKMMQNSL